MSATVINIYPCCGRGSGSWVCPPASPTDFSTLPCGMIPTGHQGYFANRDENTIWKISKTDTEWKIIDVNTIAP